MKVIEKILLGQSRFCLDRRGVLGIVPFGRPVGIQTIQERQTLKLLQTERLVILLPIIERFLFISNCQDCGFRFIISYYRI